MSSWNIWSVPVGIISLVIISPVLAIFHSALLGDTTLWPHLFSTVLPRYLLNTLLLMLGGFVGSFAKVIDFWFNNQENDNKLLEHADD